jgi:lactate dehydrogenase-like 2-hydroxyacid dehydrogenase/phosphoserine aminotransferase
MIADEVERRLRRFEFEAWVEANYRKRDERGNDLGPFTVGELERSMHRGYPADKIVLDMMREIHGYFGFPRRNRMAVGLGGGYNGFTVALMHLMNPNHLTQNVFVDTPRAETEAAATSGFFRQSWAAQVLELHTFAKAGDEARVHWADAEGHIPAASDLSRLGVKLLVGVGHETTGATTYNEQDIRHLLEWLDADTACHHALIDGTSLLGAMPWPEDLIQQALEKACFFMPFQKAVGGVSGYFAASFTPSAMAQIERNLRNPAWAIPRHLKLAVPVDGRRPLTGDRTTALGPFYDPEQDKMLGGIINTFSNTAFAETRFGLVSMRERIGGVRELNRRSVQNRDTVTEWVARHPLFQLGVADETRRGAAVTLLKVHDPEVTDSAVRAEIVTKTKQLLGYEGLTHSDGEHERGLDVARYVNAFPGTPGDFRAWIGGTRSREDVIALLNNIEYCYGRAKSSVLEEPLAAKGSHRKLQSSAVGRVRRDDPARAYRVLIVDAVGLKFGADGRPDISAVRAYIWANEGTFHHGPYSDAAALTPGIHFFYQPELSREDEILAQTATGQYDALIAAATVIPMGAVFKEGGVRIGTGTGNMASNSWGGGNGKSGTAPLMNTPSFNSRATAQMAFRALLRAAPDLPVANLHRRLVSRNFDTGRNLKEYPTEKLEGRRLAVLGFGSIGREMARIGKAFRMDVVVYARVRDREWCESEGYRFAATAVEAATDADFLSIHTGLGEFANGHFVNSGLLGHVVFEALRDGALIVNYDRGELIDIPALRNALADGKVSRVCVDAHVFVDGSGKVTGPMKPYLELAAEFPDAFELLPHAAADTEHISRVEGAIQAVSQIMRAIRYKEVVNLKGDLPADYLNGGSQTVRGVGRVPESRLVSLASDKAQAVRLRALSETLAAFWGAVVSTDNPERRAELVEKHGARMILASNRFAFLIEELGLSGPYQEGR